jgi:hypothetical protein
MHAIGMGVMVSFMLYLGITQSISFGLYLSVALLIAGLVCTARFITGSHEPREIYMGLLAGPVSLLLALVFVQ